MNAFTRLACAVAILSLGLSTIGCNNDGKYPVTGTVTWNGEPIPDGNLILTPTDPSLAPDAGAIENGVFRFRASPGSKKVEVFADRPVVDPKDAGPNQIMGLIPHEQYIPTRYNENTELTAEVARSSNEFTFELASQQGDQPAGR